MSRTSNKMISDFTGKPTTQGYCASIAEFVHSLGPVTTEHKAQVSFSVKRKFLWMWAYEQTPDGTLYLNVTLDRKVEEPGIRTVTQVSAHRWNHHVEVKSAVIASSGWLHELIRAGYAFSGS
jgi:hypothetical protein